MSYCVGCGHQTIDGTCNVRNTCELCQPSLPTFDDQLESLKILRFDWDSYGGNPIKPEAIELARALLRGIQIVPHPTGHLQIEFAAGGIDVEIYVTDQRVESVLLSVSPPKPPQGETTCPTPRSTT